MVATQTVASHLQPDLGPFTIFREIFSGRRPWLVRSACLSQPRWHSPKSSA